MKDVIQLQDHFTYRRLLRYVFPSIMMLIFTSFYVLVDGYCVSNYAGKTEFAALNLIVTFPILLGAFGFMFGTGGSALVARILGGKEEEKAYQTFTLITVSLIVLGIVTSIPSIIYLKPIALLLGATEELLGPCLVYGTILIAGNTFYILQNYFQSFMVVAERPGFGFAITVLSGITNIILDFILVGYFKGGIRAAAIASVISQMVGSLIPLVYFMSHNRSKLHFEWFHFNNKALIETCINGSSELLSNISMGLISMLYNLQLLKVAGENGVAAYGVLMYVNFIFTSTFFGYNVGSSPIVSYHYGAKNTDELKNMFRKGIMIIVCAGIMMTTACILFAPALSSLYVGYDKVLYDMTVHGFYVYSASFLMLGLNAFASSFFTALGDGVTSAIISFLRTGVFQCLAILTLPNLFGINGIWCSVIVAEGLSLIVSFSLLYIKRHIYNYC